jgi:hypothetical protein
MTRTFQVDPFIPFQALMILCLCFQTQALHSQEEEESHYFTLRGGLGIRSNSLAIKDRMAFGLLVDTNFLFIPAFAAGIRTGANISSDTILSMEAEAYARWYFWRPRIILGSYQNTLAPFAQGGLGLLTGYNGIEVAKSRGTLMAGGAIGVNIPLFGRWSIEPSVRFGYPFIAGFSLTLGYRFPSLQKAAPPNYRELLKYIIISQVEYILFPPNIAKYNENLDDTTRAHNDLILNEIIKTLTEYPEL